MSQKTGRVGSKSAGGCCGCGGQKSAASPPSKPGGGCGGGCGRENRGSAGGQGGGCGGGCGGGNGGVGSITQKMMIGGVPDVMGGGMAMPQSLPFGGSPICEKERAWIKAIAEKVTPPPIELNFRISVPQRKVRCYNPEPTPEPSIIDMCEEEEAEEPVIEEEEAWYDEE